MKRLRAWTMRLAGLFTSSRREREMNAEFDAHLAMQIADNRRAGMSQEEAMREALLKLGGLEPAKELYRYQGTAPWIEHALRDWLFGLRQLRKNPGFAFTAIAMLALGIAASISISAFVDAALIKPLPYRKPDRLLGVFESIPDFREASTLSYLDYLDWKRLNTVFSSLEAYEGARFTLQTREGAQTARGARVSAGFFRTLGVAPILGRDFQPGEDLPGAGHTIMLSYSAWQRRYGGNRDVLGKKIIERGEPKVIVGVLPRDFHFAPVGAAEFWSTLQASGSCESSRSCHDLYGIGRLKEGVSIKAALANVKAIARQLEKQYPGSNRDQGANVMPLSEYIVGSIRPVPLVLLTGAGLLLAIAGVNIASLLLVRSESRKREMAVRNALGAGRLRLISQFAAEGFTVVLFGGVLGLVVAYGAIQLLTKLISADWLAHMPYFQNLDLNPRVLGLAAMISVLALILFTAAPAIRLTPEILGGLAEGARGSAGNVWRRVGSRLVVFELAIATVLLVGAGLLGKSMYHLLQVDPGLQPDHLLTLELGAPAKRYAKDAQILALERELLERVKALPGVKSAAVSSDLPLEGWGDTTWFRILGRPWHGEHNDTPERDVSAGYFRTLGATLVRGRYFEENEDVSKPRVTIVNEALAKHYFPQEDPIGKQISGLSTPPVPVEIIGIVKDIKEGPLDTENRPVLYFPFNQNLSPYFNLVVRTSPAEHSLLPDLLAAIREQDPNIATTDQISMADKISASESVSLRRSSAWLVGGFAALALVLAIVGLYGVVAYSVNRRTREIGIRMALGAERGTVYGLILREAGWLAAFGLAAGLFCSIGAASLIRSMLFRVRAWDGMTLAAVAFVLGAAAILASFLPARRAASVDPVEALRTE